MKWKFKKKTDRPKKKKRTGKVDRVRVVDSSAQVARVALPVRLPVGRHPVKQVEKLEKRVVARLPLEHVQAGQEVVKHRTVAGHIVVVSGLVEAGQQEDELEDVVVEPSLIVAFEEEGQRLVAAQPPHFLLDLPVAVDHVDQGH